MRQLWAGPLILAGALLLAAPSREPDIPPATFVARGPSPRGPAMTRVADLLQDFAEGQGELSGPDPVASFGEAVPWRTAPGRPTVLYGWPRTGGSESTRGLLLGDGQRWCTSFSRVPGSRLRFEAIAPATPAVLEVSDGVAAARPVPVSTANDDDGVLFDEPTSNRVCLAARGDAVLVGEPRIVAPETAPDARPRWVVIVIEDTLRGDVLDPPLRAEAPTLAALAEGGLTFTNASSPASHTMAAVVPVLMGRDLMRIEPRYRVRNARWSTTIFSAPLSSIYARPNLAITHLAEDVGYHSVFLGNNGLLTGLPAFSRMSIRGSPRTGTVDSAARLGSLLPRFADERVLLVYYISATHPVSVAPDRLLRDRGCATLSGADAMRCVYAPRVRHGDEGLQALQAALAHLGLSQRTLQVVTADHGEAFEDGWSVEEKAGFGRGRMDVSHGFTESWSVLHVPLVLNGPGVPRATVDGRVSTFDIVPTIARLLQAPTPARLDGIPLPFTGQTDPGVRTFSSYGMCSHSEQRGDLQFVWWDLSMCGERYSVEDGRRFRTSLELWSGNRFVADESTDPRTVQAWFTAHAARVRDRLGADPFVLDASSLPPGAVVEVQAPHGRIVDHGPSATVRGFSGIGPAELLAGDSVLRVRFDGYRGLYAVVVVPPESPVLVRVSIPGGGSAVVHAGPLQLPMDALGQLLDPSAHRASWWSPTPPPARPVTGPTIRFWWQRLAGPEAVTHTAREIDVSRVLREWGYVR